MDGRPDMGQGPIAEGMEGEEGQDMPNVENVDESGMNQQPEGGEIKENGEGEEEQNANEWIDCELTNKLFLNVKWNKFKSIILQKC